MAPALGLLTVAAFYGSVVAVFGSPLSILSEEWPILLFHVLLATAPFGILALAGIRATLPWFVAVILTACFWGAYFASAVIAARDRSGANIGMGLVMFISPLVIGSGAWIAAKVTRSRR